MWLADHRRLGREGDFSAEVTREDGQECEAAGGDSCGYGGEKVHVVVPRGGFRDTSTAAEASNTPGMCRFRRGYH